MQDLCDGWKIAILPTMVITYHGGEFFKVSFGDVTLAFNPVSKDSKLKSTRFGSDIAFVSLNDPDFSGIDQVAHGDRAPFAVTGPGEYEVRDITIKGFPSVSNYRSAGRINTVYSVSLEGMNLAFLGALATTELSQEALEDLDDIDILFLPIGGDGVLDAAGAAKLATKLEPRLIIPMHYGDIGEKEALKKFLKEAGEQVSPTDKLTIKKKDLESKEGDIVVLSP